MSSERPKQTLKDKCKTGNNICNIYTRKKSLIITIHKEFFKNIDNSEKKGKDYEKKFIEINKYERRCSQKFKLKFISLTGRIKSIDVNC